jgi:Gluconate 2-dehydrogenase subunit 3
MESEKESAPVQTTRREVMAGIGATLVSISIEPASAKNTETGAYAETAAGRLTADQLLDYGALAEVLLPGARRAGVVDYLKKQLNRDVSLLFLRYIDYPLSQLEFYREGLRSLGKEAEQRWGAAFAAGSEQQKAGLVQDLLQATPPDWSGAPSPLFCFVIRNDAADVFYGTPAGFARLGVPYLALLQPPTAW